MCPSLSEYYFFTNFLYLVQRNNFRRFGCDVFACVDVILFKMRICCILHSCILFHSIWLLHAHSQCLPVSAYFAVCLCLQNDQSPKEKPHSRPPIKDSTRDNTATFHSQRPKNEVRGLNRTLRTRPFTHSQVAIVYHASAYLCFLFFFNALIIKANHIELFRPFIWMFCKCSCH